MIKLKEMSVFILIYNTCTSLYPNLKQSDCFGGPNFTMFISCACYLILLGETMSVPAVFGKKNLNYVCPRGFLQKKNPHILHPKCKILQPEKANFSKILQCFYTASFLSLKCKYCSHTPTKPYIFSN